MLTASRSSSTSATTIWGWSRRRSSPRGWCRPALEGTTARLARSAGRGSSGRGCGLEIVSKVNDIPKGSRLAVSTNLLASLIAALDAGDRPGAEPDRPARARGGEGRRCAGDPGRMAGRVWRGLAGLGGHLPRHQADRGRRRRPRATPSGASAGAVCCRPTGC